MDWKGGRCSSTTHIHRETTTAGRDNKSKSRQVSAGELRLATMMAGVVVRRVGSHLRSLG